MSEVRYNIAAAATTTTTTTTNNNNNNNNHEIALCPAIEVSSV
jgi:hypothetical protein